MGVDPSPDLIDDCAGPLCGTEGSRRSVTWETMPAWFTEADLDFYTGEFERSVRRAAELLPQHRQ